MKRFKYLIIYIIIVFLFAAINYIVFRHNSTSYLISDQLNKQVNYYYYWEPELDLDFFLKDAKNKKPITVDGFMTLIKPELDQFKSINDSLQFQEYQRDNWKKKLDSLYLIIEGERKDSVKSFKDSMLYASQHRVDSLKEYLDGMDSTIMILQGKYVELSHLEVELANQRAKVSTYVLEHYGSFIRNSLASQFKEINDKYINSINDINDKEQQRRDVIWNIKKQVSDFHENRCEAISYWDFVYYSICVSTTVSFGDIAPNNSLSRWIAIIELLFCLILVAVILDKIKNKLIDK